MASSAGEQMPGRRCFVTVGATSSFDGLLHAVLDEAFLKSLASLGYSQLRLQYGKDGESSVLKSLKLESQKAEQFGRWHNVSVSGFDFKAGITEEMVEAKGQEGKEGVVISHAGTGSILEAMRVNAPLIVVPNSALLHNHQEELAEELAEQGYVIHGKLDKLSDALHEVEVHRKQKKAWPPRDAKLDPAGKGLIDVLDDEMGFVD